MKEKMNISSVLCFWCGTNKGGETVLMGENDEPLPEYMFGDYDPCNKCKKNMDTHNVMIEVVTTPNNNKPIKEGYYPTGRWCLIPDTKIRDIFSEELCNKTRQFMVEPNIWNKIFNFKPEEEEQNDN